MWDRRALLKLQHFKLWNESFQHICDYFGYKAWYNLKCPEYIYSCFSDRPDPFCYPSISPKKKEMGEIEANQYNTCYFLVQIIKEMTTNESLALLFKP